MKISPILLPTAREDLMLVKTTSRVPQIPTASSLSTILSDDSSSRVYMSACESVTNSADDNQSINLPDILLPQNQQHQQQTQNASVAISTAQIKRPIPIVAGQSTTSSATVTPRLHHPKQMQLQEPEPAVNTRRIINEEILENPTNSEASVLRAQSNPIYPSITQSEVQFEEHLQRQRQERQQRLQKQPFEPPKPELKKAPYTSEMQGQAQFEEQLERQRQKQRLLEKEKQRQQQEQEQLRLQQEQEQILKELKNQIEYMEQQRIKDREEWNRKEQELLNHRHKMMETLMETKDQINTVLKSREENNKIAYDKQLRQQQLNQLQQKVADMTIHAYQIADQMPEDVPEPYAQPYAYENDFEPEDSPPRRRVNRSRSEEYLRYNTRSSSRSSHHYPEAYYNDEYPRQNNNSRNTSADGKSSVSRRSSTASSKSGNYTIVPPPRYQRRPRARSIEEARWYQEQQQWMEYMTDYQRSSLKPKRSRSVGRDSQRQYVMDDDEEDTYYEEDVPPRHYQQQQYVYGPPADYYYRRHPSMIPPQQPYMVYDQPRQRYSYKP